ncbi:hypothetical protein N5D03_09235 [Empedobacter sp. GD03861]|uniref:hypothetical protein n=1 Tax=Empedobacter sp. GD03861 TaxID=2975390 RepID=UPI00244C60C3|nr:hypothetical protein [Empedobacter sp. GD03861]MDH0674725.1 hypothetical protein [Empedobacter sp. GD03861]
MSTKKDLFEKVFEKAKNECGSSSKNGMSVHLEKVISDDYNYPITSKSFSRHFDDFVKENNLKKEISPDLLNILSYYIGYESFGDFNQKNQLIKSDEKEVNVEEIVSVELIVDDNISAEAEIINLPSKKNNFFEKIKLQRNKVIAGSGIATILASVGLFLNSINQNSSCMIWKENHYEEIECEETSPQMNAVPYNEIVFQLKKITKPDTLNFENALDKVWYTKKNGEVEFYTNYGLHPENGKTLKPVTKYILTKYVLNNEQ